MTDLPFPGDDRPVWVQRGGDLGTGPRALVALRRLRGLHRGTGKTPNRWGLPERFSIHAWVYCNDFIEGAVSHGCTHGMPPHWIQIRIVSERNETVYDEVSAAARKNH